MMDRYIALLRGINVSGQKKIKMVELKEHMGDWGFNNVRTYIQSGNIIFQSEQTNIATIEQTIRSGIRKVYEFDVGVWVRTYSDFARILSLNPYKENEEKAGSKTYFVFISQPPAAKLTEDLESKNFENEEFKITDECIFLICHAGYGKAKCNNNFFENRLKIQATTRNLRTVNTLLDMLKE